MLSQKPTAAALSGTTTSHIGRLISKTILPLDWIAFKTSNISIGREAKMWVRKAKTYSTHRKRQKNKNNYLQKTGICLLIVFYKSLVLLGKSRITPEMSTHFVVFLWTELSYLEDTVVYQPQYLFSMSNVYYYEFKRLIHFKCYTKIE